MRFYGNNFVIYIPKNIENKTKTLAEIIEDFKGWVSGMRQESRIQKDIEAIQSLPEGKYTWTTRQYTGHRYYPSSMQGGKRVFVSSAIAW